MKKWINRIRYFFFVRRYHIEDMIYETDAKAGVEGYRNLNVFVRVKGKKIKISTLNTNAWISEEITDYGIVRKIQEQL